MQGHARHDGGNSSTQAAREILENPLPAWSDKQKADESKKQINKGKINWTSYDQCYDRQTGRLKVMD